MERPIKFRFWTGNGFDYYGWVKDEDVGRHYFRGPVTAKGMSQQDIYGVTEQYTGLRDSKGVEIYEGDVVDGKGEYSTRLPQPVIWWDTGWYAGRIEEGRRCVTSLSAIEQPEVIGNIHQNPELVKEGV